MIYDLDLRCWGLTQFSKFERTWEAGIGTNIIRFCYVLLILEHSLLEEPHGILLSIWGQLSQIFQESTIFHELIPFKIKDIKVFFFLYL